MAILLALVGGFTAMLLVGYLAAVALVFALDVAATGFDLLAAQVRRRTAAPRWTEHHWSDDELHAPAVARKAHPGVQEHDPDQCIA